MRLLFVTPYYYPELKFGGPPKRLHALARHLSRRGHDVAVATIHSESSGGITETTVAGVEVHSLPWLGPSQCPLPGDFARLRRLITAADVVHCFGLYNLVCPIAAFLAARVGKPFLVEPMGMFVPRMRSLAVKRFYNMTLTKWMARSAAGIIATSELEAKELAPLSRYAPIATRWNGIDICEFAELPPRYLMRQNWGVNDDEQVVLSLGRISAKKNLIELVEAFTAAKVPRSRLVVAGPVSEPTYLARLQSTAERSDMAERITISNALYGDKLLAALAAADVFALVSENENFGNAAGEAVAAGVPVLVTTTCGIAPLIHGRAGLAIPLGSEALREGIKTMLDPLKRQTLTSQTEEVKRELSWDEPVRKTEEVYQRIIGGH